MQTYGGGLWHTWFDRDLKLAGRVILNQKGEIVSKLVHINKPLIRIPTLAIHLTEDRNKFEFNKERHLKPVFSLDSHPMSAMGGHSSSLLGLIAE